MTDERNYPPPSVQEESLSRIPFTRKDEENIKKMASWMNIAGIISILSGIGSILAVFLTLNLGQTFNAVISFLIGGWMIKAAAAFRQVAVTDDDDQDFLVVGFTNLRSVFLLQSVLVIIALSLMAVMIPFVFLLSMAPLL